MRSICAAQSSLQQVPIPDDYIAFQIGEAMQIHSGGTLQATPHAVSVRPCCACCGCCCPMLTHCTARWKQAVSGRDGSKGVSRASFALHFQPTFGAITLARSHSQPQSSAVACCLRLPNRTDEPMTVPRTMDPSKALEGTLGKFLPFGVPALGDRDRKSTRLNSSHT